MKAGVVLGCLIVKFRKPDSAMIHGSLLLNSVDVHRIIHHTPESPLWFIQVTMGRESREMRRIAKIPNVLAVSKLTISASTLQPQYSLRPVKRRTRIRRK